ncbi:hypothetical protein ACJMK2_022102 [Sinanodonta woodiana]|uniref:Uncharacterized protein n=1 Tax=Sinanodonta woodiana TaxID=1069815 RepID=A0ABD3TJW1_SINWO
MSSLICFVVAVGLVSVQGTSIIRHAMSNAHAHNTDLSNEMITGLIRNKLRNYGPLDKVFLEKKGTPSFTCKNSSCEFCEYGFCLIVTYQLESDNFLVKGTFIHGYVFSSNIHVRPWRDCETIDTLILSLEACVTLSKVQILNGRICADIDVEAGSLLERKFSAVCI